MKDYIAIEVNSDFATDFYKSNDLAKLKDLIREAEPPLVGGQIFYVYETEGVLIRKLGTVSRLVSDLKWSKGLQ